MERRDIEALMRDAFAGIRLGDGLSLRQAEAIDRDSGGFTQAEFDRIPQCEVTHDWRLIPDEELPLGEHIGYLDPEGLRYYLPALLIWGSITTTTTICGSTFRPTCPSSAP